MKNNQGKAKILRESKINFLFLLVVILISIIAYFAIAKNFQKLLTEYSITLVDTMTQQGVDIVENELQNGREEILDLASAFHPAEEIEQIIFPSKYKDNQAEELVYVSNDFSISSKQNQPSIQTREDIQDALRGEVAIFGPYFNEDKEYVICYSAPVKVNDEIVGVLSLEKDGYRFCELIKNIRFQETGESYIINRDGTDIAVSDPNHIEWVNEQYNAGEILAQQEDPITRAIYELEQKGLQGESGVGTYHWNDGLVYLVYHPIPSTGWLLLGGMREEEIVSMTQTAMFSSIKNSPVLAIALGIFAMLTILIIYWILTSAKKNAEINEKLELIANQDALTGLLNRRFLETQLVKQWNARVACPNQGAVFMMDIDNFKKYNDYFGHPQGDACLRTVASVLKGVFDDCQGYITRYGGEEFVAVVFSMNQETALGIAQKICQFVEAEGIEDGKGGVMTISVGVCYIPDLTKTNLYACIDRADKAMYQAKLHGKNRAESADEKTM